MYRTCLYCMGSLGRNEALEWFQVGRLVAFDAAKGRLWAVCPRCGRWNLAPIEERWEAVEEAERCFRDTRLRVQSENIGLAQMPDGSRLIRIGSPVPGELAAWRYGRMLRVRRRTYVAGSVLAAAGSGALRLSVFGVALLVAPIAFAVAGPLGSGAASLGAVSLANALAGARRRYLLNAPMLTITDPGPRWAAPLVIRRWHVLSATIEPADTDGLSVVCRDVERSWPRHHFDPPPHPADAVRLEGETAVLALERGLLTVNRRGAAERELRGAEALLGRAGSAAAYLASLAPQRRTLTPIGGRMPLRSAEALALEMALHEESERRAMEGELAALEAAWRQAEEIAAIADALPDDPLRRPKPERA